MLRVRSNYVHQLCAARATHKAESRPVFRSAPYTCTRLLGHIPDFSSRWAQRNSRRDASMQHVASAHMVLAAVIKRHGLATSGERVPAGRTACINTHAHHKHHFGRCSTAWALSACARHPRVRLAGRNDGAHRTGARVRRPCTVRVDAQQTCRRDARASDMASAAAKEQRVGDLCSMGAKDKSYSTPYSRVVPHRSTDGAITSLTSEIGRDPVLSGMYGRNYRHQMPTTPSTRSAIHPIIATGS